MIDFSLLARVDEAIKKHAHDRITIFRQNNKSAEYFGGWRYISGDAPIVYDIFVSGERIVIHVDIDELEELMPPTHETICDFAYTTGLVDSLGCIRFSLKAANDQVSDAMNDLATALKGLGLLKDKDSFLDSIENWYDEDEDKDDDKDDE